MTIALHLVAGVDFNTLPQQLVNGLLLGAIYALIALGYTMVYGVLRLINFAHGEVYMLGGYVALFVSYFLGYTKGATPPDKPILDPGMLGNVGLLLLVIGIAAVAAVKFKPGLPMFVKVV